MKSAKGILGSLLAIVIIVSSLYAIPSLGQYNTSSDKIIHTYTSKNYALIHGYNPIIQQKTLQHAPLKNDDDIFNSHNNYAYIKLIDRRTLKIYMFRPVGRYEHVFLTPDEKYVVCLSSETKDNPFQLLVLNTKGAIIKKRHIAATEAAMADTALRRFHAIYPKILPYLRLNKRVYKIDETFYLDFKNTDTTIVTNAAAKHLNHFAQPNHLSKNIIEQSNAVAWYDKTNPQAKITATKDSVVSVQIKTPNGWLNIPINE